MITIKVDPSVRDKWSGETMLAVFNMEGLSEDQSAKTELDKEIDSIVSWVQQQGKSILDDPRLQRMRATFRAMPDMDPSRYRPASESLIRRCLDKGLYRIRPLVDVNNLLSIRLRVPIGIYNLDQAISDSWVYRLGYPGESYFTISNQSKSASGKLVIADSSGVIGSPVADSGRAAIYGETSQILLIVYLPFYTSKDEAEEMVKEVIQTFGQFFNSDSIRHEFLLV